MVAKLLDVVVGRIDSLVSDSHYGSFAFLDVSRFGFVFDGFVFEFTEWTIFRVGIGLDFVFFGSLSRCEFGAVGRPFYAVFGNFKGNPFVHYFLLLPREKRVSIEDYVVASDQSPVLWVP